MSDLQDRLADALRARYRVERTLGEGGMGSVFLAHDLKHGRQVAIKVLRPDLAHELGVDRFLREIRIAAGLSHPNILPLFDSGEADGLLYFVMPHVDGETLRDRLRREGALPLGPALRLVEEIGGALARAHRSGVVHRDIKPENILLEEGHALVADFGVARAVDVAGGARLTRTGIAVGTPAYMSPEQLTGDASEDARSDVYSLGCVAYEMLAGEPPFTGSTTPAVVAGHLARDVPPLRSKRDDVPPGVERVIRRALAKDPAERFATTEELTEALSLAMTSEARVAERRRETRRRWGSRLGGTVAVVLLGLGGWWLTDALSGAAVERLAVLPASNLTRDPAHDLFVDGVHEALVTELQRAGIPIVGRQSVLRYRGTEESIAQIASELGVDALIQPAVGREGDSVVVDVSLYDARSELVTWSASFGARLQGVLGLYRDVSGQIAGELGTVLTASTRARLAERPVVDARMMEDVTLGYAHLRRFNPQDLAIALRYFESALAVDSLHAPALAGLASVWGYRAQSNLMPIAEARPRIEGPLRRALEQDPDYARARFLEAALLVWADWDFEAGERAIRRALELDPNDAETRVFYAHLLAILGREDDALRHGRLALELDPLNAFVSGLHGALLATLGRSEEAIDLLRRTLADNPGSGFGRVPLIETLAAEGRFDESLEVRRALYASFGDTDLVRALEGVSAETEYREAMRDVAEILAARSERTFVGAMPVAAAYAAAGDTARALDWLEITVERRNPNAPYIGVVPTYRGFHDHPRFQAIAREVGVTPRHPAAQ